MTEKNNPNCIVKAFENNPISIIEENIDNKKIYWFRASDIGKALNLSNIRVSIQNYDEDEQVVRKAYDLRGCEQDAAKAYDEKAKELNIKHNKNYKLNICN